MARNMVGEGAVILIPIPAGGCVSGGSFNGTTTPPGQPLLIGNDMVGIPSNSFDAGDVGNVNVHLCGVFSNIKKKSSDTFSTGDKLYLDNTNHELTTTSSGNVWAGWAMVDGAANETSCTVRLKC